MIRGQGVEIEATSTVVLEGVEGDEAYEVEYLVKARCSYRPGVYSGPPERCYPDESECEVEEITLTAIRDAKQKELLGEVELEAAIIEMLLGSEEVEEKCWEAFMEGA